MILTGDSKELLKTLPANYFDSVVTDPPYGLSKEPKILEVLTKWLAGEDYQSTGGGFMGKDWDSFVPGPAHWREVYRVLKPGGHALVFAGTRTQDLMSMALRMAGFEVRDCLMWLYGSGFPKSSCVSKAIDKKLGATRQIISEQPAYGIGNGGVAFDGHSSTATAKVDMPATPASQYWNGWGSAVKPAYEPIILVRKPLDGTIAANVLKHGVGGMNIDGCRITKDDNDRNNYGVNGDEPSNASNGVVTNPRDRVAYQPSDLGRFPANVIHDGLDETWSRYFYCAKASKADRNAGLEHFSELNKGAVMGVDDDYKGLNNPRAGAGRTGGGNKNIHPTVKPTDLMRYLCRLITPVNGTVLDPFAGSGSTGRGAILEGFKFIGVEFDDVYSEIAKARIQNAIDETVISK